MANNFRIMVHRNSESLHLKLTGDFDGTSAYELIEAMKRNCNGSSRVFIHTNCLKNVYPFGRNVFLNNLGEVKRQVAFIVFTGEKASKLAPEDTTGPWGNNSVSIH
jgi:hypothetical protein